MSRCRHAARTLLMLPLLGLGGGTALAEDPPPAMMIVLDGSGSMWGRIEGDKPSKLQAARDALRSVLPQLPREARVGLASFGHRRKGDCSDVETIIAPEPLDLERVMQPIERLNPKGKGPLVLAIREAAKALGDGRRATIVVVHDGADNCQQDACAAAAEIAKAQPGLRIHTVGLALDAEEARKSTCVAAATGGKSFDARDAGQIEAAIAEATRLATRDPGRDRKPEPAAAALPAPPKPVPVARPAVLGLDVAAALAADGSIIEAPVRWRVYRADGNGPTLLDAVAPRLAHKIAPGSYVVEARLGLAQARQKVEVGDRAGADGPTRIPLNAGVITPAARAHKDGDIVEDATYTIRVSRPGVAQPITDTLWIGRGGGSDIVLPEGAYVVRAELGRVSREETVKLAAGSRKSLDLVLGSGRLELSASLHDGGPALDRVTFIVSEDDPDAPDGRREVARSAAPNPDFVLPAGTYYATARAAGAESRQRIAVGAGDNLRRTIALGVSRLSLRTRMDSPASGPAHRILTRVTPLRDNSVEAHRSAASDPEFLLPPGRYKIQTQAGLQNARAERIVEIRTGENLSLEVPIEAAYVLVRLADGTPATADLYWEVRDAGGQVVWRTTQSEARMILAPGRYTTQVEWRGRRLERAFDVERGSQKTVTVAAE